MIQIIVSCRECYSIRSIALPATGGLDFIHDCAQTAPWNIETKTSIPTAENVLEMPTVPKPQSSQVRNVRDMWEKTDGILANEIPRYW